MTWVICFNIYNQKSVCVFRSKQVDFSHSSCDFLMAGDVGYVAAAIKTVADTRVGDTVTLASVFIYMFMMEQHF